jgi:hypothetical protein
MEETNRVVLSFFLFRFRKRKEKKERKKKRKRKGLGWGDFHLRKIKSHNWQSALPFFFFLFCISLKQLMAFRFPLYAI